MRETSRPLGEFLSRRRTGHDAAPLDPNLQNPNPFAATEHINALRDPQPEEAIRFAKRWLEHHKQDRADHAHVLAALAMVYNKVGQRERAIESFVQSLIVKPDNEKVKDLIEQNILYFRNARNAIAIIDRILVENKNLTEDAKTALQALLKLAIDFVTRAAKKRSE